MKRHNRLKALTLALIVGACGPAEVILDLRQDKDQDSYFDDQETEGNTDPNDPADHPSPRGWPIDACRHSLSETGNSVGETTANFELEDQDGTMVSLHDFCDQAVLLVGAAFW